MTDTAWRRVLLTVCDHGPVTCDEASNLSGVRWSTVSQVLSEAKRHGALTRDGSKYRATLSRETIVALKTFYEIRNTGGAARAVAIKDAERKVIEWAEVYVSSFDGCDDYGWDELIAAVRALRTARGEA